MLLSAFKFKFSCGHTFSFLLGMYLGESLDQVVILSEHLRNWRTGFQSGRTAVRFHSGTWRLQLLRVLSSMRSIFLMVAVLLGVRCRLAVAAARISPMATDTERLSTCAVGTLRVLCDKASAHQTHNWQILSSTPRALFLLSLCVLWCTKVFSF